MKKILGQGVRINEKIFTTINEETIITDLTLFFY